MTSTKSLVLKNPRIFTPSLHYHCAYDIVHSQKQQSQDSYVDSRTILFYHFLGPLYNCTYKKTMFPMFSSGKNLLDNNTFLNPGGGRID